VALASHHDLRRPGGDPCGIRPLFDAHTQEAVPDGAGRLEWPTSISLAAIGARVISVSAC
jgi:hypothetical protein